MKYFLLGLAAILIGYAINWIITCGIIFLIVWCFGLPFSLLKATGVWIIIKIVKNIFSSTERKK